MKDGLSKIQRTRLALWALSEAEARATAPAHIEAEVMRAWDATRAERARVRAKPRAVPAGPLAAVVAKWVLVPAMAVGIGWIAVRSVTPVASSRAPDAARAPSGAMDAAGARAVVEPSASSFSETSAGAAGELRHRDADPVPSSAPSPSRRRGATTPAGRPAAVVFVGEVMSAGERIQVVRMRVLRSTLASLGVSVAEGSDTVFVDLLVGEDGVARALQVEM